MKIRPKPLAPPCRAVRSDEPPHVYSSRADGEPETEDPGVRAVLDSYFPRRPALGQRLTTFASDQALGRNPLEEPEVVPSWLSRLFW